MQQSMKNVNAASKWNLFLCTLVGWLLLVPLGVYLRQSAAATADDDKDDPISLLESGNETTRLEKVFIRLTDGLSARDDDQWCQRMADGKMEAAERTRLKQWTFKSEKKLLAALWAEKETGKKATGFENAGCLRLRNLFPFQDEPLSKEERQYPLAYGLLVHKSPIQVLAMISAIYQPQNAYCVAIDEKAEPQFKQAMLLLADCFPNIFVMSTVGPVQWCKFGITRAVFNCLRHLSQMKHDWRYYQYLSGVDLPLKTNLEVFEFLIRMPKFAVSSAQMVRIFKALNGSVNMEVTQFDRGRRHDGTLEAEPPLPLWKSSLSALISRPAANAMVGSEKVQQLLRFLQSTDCSDESLWATAAGNPKDLSVPGGFSAADFYATINKCKKARERKTVVVQNGKQQRRGNGTMLAPTFYYISRYQVWEAGEKCKGKLVKGSCAFGVDDLPVLIRRPELIAHKMHLDYQPAAYFCLWKIVQERTLDERRQKEFKADSYSHLWPTMLKASNGGNQKDPNSDMCRLLVH